MTTNKEVMAKNILHYMEKKGVNATDVCTALGFKHNTFSDWVNAKTYPRIDAIEMMANYFGVPKAFLVEFQPLDVFTAEERNLIHQYRKADETTKTMILRMLAYDEGFNNDH